MAAKRFSILTPIY